MLVSSVGSEACNGVQAVADEEQAVPAASFQSDVAARGSSPTGEA